MSFNIPQNPFSFIDKTAANSIFQASNQASSTDLEPIFDIGNIMTKPVSSSQDDMDEANKFVALMSSSSASIHSIFAQQGDGSIPYPLKMNENFGDVWHTSPTTFEVVFGVGDGDKPYTNRFEFDSAPDCVEDDNHNFVYSGTIDGTKVELVSKNNKIVSITQYSDDGKVIGTIDYDSASGDRTIKEYCEDGKTLKSVSVQGLDGVYTKTKYYENGNIDEVAQRKPDGSYYEANYFEDGQLSLKRYINSDNQETLRIHYPSPDYLVSLSLNGGEVDLDMQEYEKTSTPEGYKYTSPDGKTTVVLTQDGGYSVTVDGVTKKYNEKGEPLNK